MTVAEVLRRVRRIDVSTRRLVRDVLAGEYSSVFKGRGMEFAEVREYQPGDEVRTIDWNVTARLGTAFVKRFVEERELTVVFVVDHSASDAFGSRGRTKAELATEVCAVLAMSATRNNDRVGAVLFTDRVERFIRPTKGRLQVLRVIAELVRFEPAGRRTDLAAALEFVNRVIRRHAVVFVVSDFLAASYERALGRAARRHDTIAVQLRDPRERELPGAGLLVVRDPESGGWRYLDSDDARTRAEFRRPGETFDRALEATLRRTGIDLIRLDTDRGYAEPLLAFFRRREQRARR